MGALRVNQSTVQRVRSEVMQTHNLPDRVTGKDGKSYPATRQPIGPLRSKVDREERWARAREMAEQGYTTRAEGNGWS